MTVEIPAVLEAGRYYLAAGSFQGRPGGAGPAVSRNDPLNSYAFTYYPGVTDIGRATVLDVKSGSDLAVDLPIGTQQLYRIRGKVVDGAYRDNLPQRSMWSFVAVARRQWRHLFFAAGYNATTGVFEAGNLLPGMYMLRDNR